LPVAGSGPMNTRNRHTPGDRSVIEPFTPTNTSPRLVQRHLLEFLRI
jgi:hypothetical protein